MLRGRHSQVFLIGPFAVKIFNKGLKKNIQKEWDFLHQLKKYKLAPKPHFRFGRAIIMERINGVAIREMLPNEIKIHAIDFLEALHTLDKLGIQKEECHRPNKHFILTESGVRLIDFERSLHVWRCSYTFDQDVIRFLWTTNRRRRRR